MSRFQAPELLLDLPADEQHAGFIGGAGGGGLEEGPDQAADFLQFRIEVPAAVLVTVA